MADDFTPVNPTGDDFSPIAPGPPDFQQLMRNRVLESQQPPPQNFWTSPRGLIRTGGRQLLNGIAALANGRKAAGTADVLEGAGSAAAPAAIPLIAATPLASIVGALLGMGGQRVANTIATKAGASPDTARLAGDIGGLITGPAAAGVTGAVSRRLAAPIAETALGIRGVERAYGATPGKAILTETSGIKPATVEASARSKLADLMTQLEQMASRTKQPVSLQPARDVLVKRAADAAAANSTGTPADIAPLLNQLTTPVPGFAGATEYPSGAFTPITYNRPALTITGPNGQPITGPPVVVPGAAPQLAIAPEQPASTFLDIKRQFDRDFIRNWSPAVNTQGQLGAARAAYGALAGAFNKAVPGAAAVNQRIASLVPVAERARLTDLGANAVQRLLARAARPTGGLAPVIFGGVEGGPLGAAAALAGLAGVESPSMRLLLARRLWGRAGASGPTVPAAIAPLVVQRLSGGR